MVCTDRGRLRLFQRVHLLPLSYSTPFSGLRKPSVKKSIDTQLESVGSRQARPGSYQNIINVQVRVSFGQVSSSCCLDVAPVLY